MSNMRKGSKGHVPTSKAKFTMHICANIRYVLKYYFFYISGERRSWLYYPHVHADLELHFPHMLRSYRFDTVTWCTDKSVSKTQSVFVRFKYGIFICTYNLLFVRDVVRSDFSHYLKGNIVLHSRLFGAQHNKGNVKGNWYRYRDTALSKLFCFPSEKGPTWEHILSFQSSHLFRRALMNR